MQILLSQLALISVSKAVTVVKTVALIYNSIIVHLTGNFFWYHMSRVTYHDHYCTIVAYYQCVQHGRDINASVTTPNFIYKR